MLKGDPAATRASRKCCAQGDSVSSTGATQAPAQILTELRRANFRLLHLPYLETIRRRSYLRPIWESVEELIRHCLVDESEIQRRLADLAVMDPAAVAVAGGNRLSPYSRCRRAIIDRPSEAGLLGDEPAARRPSPVTTPSARGCGLVSRKSIAKGTLRGFATVELPIELKLVDCPIFVGPNGPRAPLPYNPVLDC